MANMSYCRFQNTSSDLSDCLDALAWREDLSIVEVKYGKAMFKEFLTFCRDNYIIESFDEEAVCAMFDSLLEKEEE